MYTVIACTHAVYTIYTNIFLHRVEEASVAAKEAAAELIGQGLLDEQAASLQLEEQAAAMAAIAVMPAVGEVEVVAEDQQPLSLHTWQVLACTGLQQGLPWGL